MVDCEQMETSRGLFYTQHILCELRVARIIYIRCIYGISGRDINKYTVIYGAYIRFWPTLRAQFAKKFSARGVPTNIGCVARSVASN